MHCCQVPSMLLPYMHIILMCTIIIDMCLCDSLVHFIMQCDDVIRLYDLNNTLLQYGVRPWINSSLTGRLLVFFHATVHNMDWKAKRHLLNIELFWLYWFDVQHKYILNIWKYWDIIPLACILFYFGTHYILPSARHLWCSRCTCLHDLSSLRVYYWIL